MECKILTRWHQCLSTKVTNGSFIHCSTFSSNTLSWSPLNKNDYFMTKWSLRWLCFLQIDTKFSTKEQRLPKINTNLLISNCLQFNMGKHTTGRNALLTARNDIYSELHFLPHTNPFKFIFHALNGGDQWSIWKGKITVIVSFASFAKWVS